MASDLISKAQSIIFNSPLYTNNNSRLALIALGTTYTLYKTLSWSASFLKPILTFEKDLPSRYGKGSWAVITGASDGIGKAYCFQLAKRGFNIALVARNQEKTDAVAKELKDAFPLVQTRVIIVDFADCHKDGFADKIYNEVIDIDVSILVNNVGKAPCKEYLKQDVKEIRDATIVNCMAQALMTRILLPKLINREHKSGIISTSSVSALYPQPYFQLYSATKKFMDHFSQSIGLEYPNLDVLCLKPHFVITALTGHKGVDGNTITAEVFANTGLRLLGSEASSHGHWKHRLHAFRTSLLPESFKLESTRESYKQIKELEAKRSKK